MKRTSLESEPTDFEGLAGALDDSIHHYLAKSTWDFRRFLLLSL